MTEQQQMAIAIENRDRCLVGTPDCATHGDDIMWLMGYADWAIEVELIAPKLSADSIESEPTQSVDRQASR